MADDDRREEAANPSDCPSPTSRSSLIETPEEKQPTAKRSQVQLATRVQALALHGVGIPFAQITEKTGYSRSGFYELRRKAIQRGYVDGGPILDEHVVDGKREAALRLPDSPYSPFQVIDLKFHALGGILRTLKGRVKGQCVAGYALHATERAAVPHVLAVLARAMVEGYKSGSDENVKTPAGSSFIKVSTERAGWTLPEETNIVPAPELLDGSLETSTAASRHFEEEIEQVVAKGRMRVVVQTTREATLAAVDRPKVLRYRP
ncbi:hypothetical protein DL768_004737 [Monosporascus sp. mg162]|nr:hypothetical protein DL768_004737 [Monosporascus sp. mg162]